MKVLDSCLIDVELRVFTICAITCIFFCLGSFGCKMNVRYFFLDSWYKDTHMSHVHLFIITPFSKLNKYPLPHRMISSEPIYIKVTTL